MKNKCFIPQVRFFGVLTGGLILLALTCLNSFAYERYKNPTTETGNCSTCHGNFTSGVSTKGSVFPSNNKHTMHRSGSYMDTACDLCHTSTDNRNPFIGSSDGIPGEVAGLGCTGCHNGVGLRRHHAAAGLPTCAVCHTNDVNLIPPAENVSPPYYGTAYTLANNPCNDVAGANLNENWTVGDFIGLDNDGNNVYDRLDPACTPYRIVEVVLEGNDVRVTWETTGGRTDVLQAASKVEGPYSDVGSPITISGITPVTTNAVDSGVAASSPRFYRLRLIP